MYTDDIRQQVREEDRQRWYDPLLGICDTIGRAGRLLIRGKPSKLDNDAEGWDHLSNPDPGREE